MINNGRIYLWIPSMLSLSTLSAEAVATINAVHTALGRPTVTEADQNPYIMALNDLDMGGAPFTRDYEPGMAICGPIENLAYLGLDYVTLIVTFGGEIEALPVFFELTEAELDQPVPAAFPERTYVDAEAQEGAQEQEHTWRTWGVSGASHAPVEYGGKWYRSVNYGASGTPLRASQWVGYRNGGGIVKTLAEYQAIQAANAPAL